jgi:hypothetical protein
LSEQLSILDTPHVRGSETSRAAAENIKPYVLSLRERVYFYIKRFGPVTDQQIEEGLGLAGSTARPRRIELLGGGLIKKFDDDGLTRAKRKASRWVVT